MTIGARALRGSLWAYGSYVGGRLLVLAATAVLARVLSPEDFGVVALALVFTALLETIKDFGVSQALIIVPAEEVERRAHTAWTASMLLSLLAWGLVSAVAPLAARFFDEPDLTLLIIVLGLNFPLRALGVTHYVLAQKRLEFRKRTIAEMSDVLLRGALSIALAIAGAGPWALVVGYLVGTAAMDVALWLLVRWRPRPRLDRRDLRSLAGFGGQLTVLEVTTGVVDNADNLFVGRLLGAQALGFYAIAYRLPQLVVQNLGIIAAQILFPAFASVRRDALGHAFLVALRYTAALTFPMAALLSILAGPLVHVAFGGQWGAAVEPMQVLAPYMAVATLSVPAGTAYKATGRVWILLALAVPRTVLLIVSLVLFADEGLVAVALCQLAGAAGLALASQVITARLLGTGLRENLRALWPPVGATAVLAAVLVAVVELVPGYVAQALVGVPVGLAAYAAALLALAPDLLADVRLKLGRTAVPA